MKLEKQAYEYVRQSHLLQPNKSVVVACSGGIDSMVLLHFLLENKALFQIKHVAAIHVNHMLRGEDSMRDAQFVEAFCERENIRFYKKAIPIPHIVSKEQGNVEAICRRERYGFFEEVMKTNQYDYLAMAHHGDDQVENVLMALTKGLHRNGILGMPNERPFCEGMLIRPFLSCTRHQIEEYATRHQIAFQEDYTNSEDEYLRNRMRHHVVPLLKKENPKVVEAIQVFTERKKEDEHLLQQLAMQKYHELIFTPKNGMLGIHLIGFRRQPVALQRRIIQLLLNYLYKDIAIVQSYTLTENILQLAMIVEGNSTIHLPKDFKMHRQYDQLIIEASQEEPQATLLPTVSFNEWISLPHHLKLYIATEQKVSFAEGRMYYANSSEIGRAFQVCTRQEGDRIVVLGMTKPKKVSRILIDEKIPEAMRDTWPILKKEDGEIIAVIGLRVSHYFSKTKRPTDDLLLVVDRDTL
ncbi:tRNA lysidine(34) synthetase TilS [Kurthia senegalensis]|uniref:tRNA lysidine(34) synthetase TilS n=1 Tax=Kurthia senegalensis TaxID=1033740 RepID=UPI000289EB8A|nr:tRNA lysidine(34) synthetase TilS [Kurthia senegalensis]